MTVSVVSGTLSSEVVVMVTTEGGSKYIHVQYQV